MAAEWDVRVGGEFVSYFGYASSDVSTDPSVDFDGFDVKSDVTIAFSPEITLENGLQFGAVVELDGQEGNIGDSFLFIDSSGGTVEFGSRPSAGYNMFYSAPDESILGTNDGSSGDFIPFDEEAGSALVGNDTGLGTLNSTFIENGANANDNADRINYYTPRIAGFQLGVSYARDPNASSNAQVDITAAGGLHDLFDVGLNYVAEFGDVGVAVAGRWGIASLEGSAAVAGSSGLVVDGTGATVVRATTADVQATDTVVLAPVDAVAAGQSSNPTILGFGANVSYGGFTIGGSWAEQNDTVLSDGQAFDVGVSYATGPWAVSFTYQYGQNVDDELANGSDEELQQFVAGVTYELAEGVAVGGFAAYVDFDEEFSDDGTAGGDDVDGFIIGGGVALEF